MVFQRFSLGIRMLAAGEDPSDNLNKVFGAVPASAVRSFMVHHRTTEDREGRVDCIVFSDMSLSESRALYALLCARPAVTARLCFDRPYVQNNYFESLPDFTCLGQVNEAGDLVGGEAAFGTMRFTGSEPPSYKRVRTLLVAAARVGELTPEEVCRMEMQAISERMQDVRVIPYPVHDGSAGTLCSLVAALGGRFVSSAVPEEESAVIGILPDRTAVIDRAEDVRLLTEFVSSLGYKRILLPKDAQYSADAASDTVITAYDGGIGRYLEDTGLMQKLKSADLMTVTGEPAAASHIRDFVKNARIRTIVIEAEDASALQEKLSAALGRITGKEA